MREGWQIRPLGEVCEIYNGGTPSTNIPEYWDGGIQWITPKDMGKSKDMYVSHCERTISQEGVEHSSTKVLPERSVIVSSRAPIGYVAINEVPMATNQGCKGFVLGKEIYPEFLYYFLLSSTDLLNRLGTGATFKEVSGKKMAGIELPFPSLPEQQRIVDILDREFAEIDALKANAEKSLQAAKDLFQATLKKELEPKEGWKKTCLDDVCNIVGRIGFRGYTRNDIVPSPDDGAISLSPSNIVDGEMRYDKLTYISWFKYDESPEIKIFNGDILLVKTGSSYGKSAIIRDLPHEATINPQLVVLKNIKIDTQYLHFFLSTDNAKNKFDEFVSGTAIPTFSQRNLGQMEICFPNPETTLGIVSKLNNLRKRLTSFQENYQKTLTLCDDLKQALLRKAFNGKL